jgi:hypothetical protein
MFGGFPAAAAFHDAVSAAHAEHVKSLQDQRETLNAIGDRARRAAAEFTDMEEHNAAKLQALACISAA